MIAFNTKTSTFVSIWQNPWRGSDLDQMSWVIETEIITRGIVFYSVCWELFVSFWDKDRVLIHLQPSPFCRCMPISHITGMALQQTVQPTDKSNFPTWFCCHCHSRSLNESRCKAATEGRKNGPKLSTYCSASTLLSKSRDCSVIFWEIQIHLAAADFCGISWCVLGMCQVGKEKREAPRIFGKAPTQLSPVSGIPSLQGLFFPGEGAWLVKHCGSTPGISEYTEDVTVTPQLHVVTSIKGFTVHSLL